MDNGAGATALAGGGDSAAKTHPRPRRRELRQNLGDMPRRQSCGEHVVFWVVFSLAAGLTLYYGVDVTPTAARQVCSLNLEERQRPVATVSTQKDEEWNNAIIFPHHQSNSHRSKPADDKPKDASHASVAKEIEQEYDKHHAPTSSEDMESACDADLSGSGQWFVPGDTSFHGAAMHWKTASDVDSHRRNTAPWSISVVTQLGVNRLARLENMLEAWQGPISAAVQVCSQQDMDAVAIWYERMRSTQRNRLAERFLSLHLVLASADPYPINVMRNLAQDGVAALQVKGTVGTDFSFVVDVDARTGSQAIEVSQDVKRGLETLYGPDAREAVATESTVLCVAAFELAVKASAGALTSRHLPRDYTELRAMVNAGAVRPMHPGHRSYSGPFNHAEWLLRRDAYKLAYEVMFEPYFIRLTNPSTTDWPKFPQEFKGRGFNKQAHHFELFARGFTYAVMASHGDLYWKVFLDGLDSKVRKRQLPDGVSCRDDLGNPVVDVVYTWVNGSDPDHVAARLQVIPQEAFQGSMDVGEGRSVSVKDLAHRFRDYGRASTLLFSLRSIRAHAPWVRRIYIVVAGKQRPAWMNLEAAAADDTNIHFISHETLFAQHDGAAPGHPLAADALPTFNSCAIESQLHRIPGLAACYMYLNDDFLLGRSLSFEDLWPSDEPVPRVDFGVERAPRVGRDPWQQKIANVGKMMHRDLALRWEHMFTVGHQGFFFVKNVVREHANDGERLFLFGCRFSVYIRLNDFSAEDNALDAALTRIQKRQPLWICINDLVTEPSQDLEDELFRVLNTLFPTPSPFER
ncbi:LARGE xylosyl- and glucuronyltransferase 1 [Hondaea fermentalgiana]|uniref:LARGE xylosyl-and glucuronyltransferase 1 n=1 Tax=Hondaea fermentalgiana TaxID=2315210 RepID=A0A2R5GIR0_9STRA|nr:LARGE xylosyl- and glucuronyltransferase 1 [Hondaea fermentalgiana]|eukprot:GBG30199.1 LARGE xylosyl- and glucuronyltransferase 1 [Hondaea fermentalgiana]